jgi:hypothetical protein
VSVVVTHKDVEKPITVIKMGMGVGEMGVENFVNVVDLQKIYALIIAMKIGAITLKKIVKHFVNDAIRCIINVGSR